MGGELILIIEDNALNLKLVRDVLDHEGYRTIAAVTAEAGLALATAEVPDLILMDVQLRRWMESARSRNSVLNSGRPRSRSWS